MVQNNYNLNIKQKIILIAITVFMVVFFLSYYLILPSIDEIKKIQAQVALEKNDLENKLSRGQSTKKLTDNLKKIEPKIESLDNIFISQERVLEFITALEELAGKDSINQKINLALESSTKSDNYNKTPISIDAEGGYGNLITYLSDLEKINYYINIKNLTISAADAEGGTLNLRINGDTYWK